MKKQTLNFLEHYRQDIVGMSLIVDLVISLIFFHIGGLTYLFTICGLFIVLSGAINSLICSITNTEDDTATFFILCVGLIIAMLPQFCDIF